MDVEELSDREEALADELVEHVNDMLRKNIPAERQPAMIEEIVGQLEEGKDGL